MDASLRSPGRWLSPAVRGRGLKPSNADIMRRFKVARRARAWIETESKGSLQSVQRVARRARAWIETLRQ